MPSRARLLALPPLALAAATGLLGVGLSEVLLRPRRAPRRDHEVLAVGAAEVTLGADEETLREGRYGIHWPDGHAVVGPVLGHRGRGAVRVLERVDFGTLAPGRVGIGHVAVGDPLSAHGLAFEEVTCESDAGPMPCWEVPAAPRAAGVPGAADGGGAGDGAPHARQTSHDAAVTAPGELSRTWAVAVHGYGGSRASALDVLPILHRLGMPAICVAYRNDPGAPPSRDRRYHLGATEWRDVDAAMEHARRRGAERIVLLGWSMGGQIALQAYEHSPLRHLVAGLFLDCPVVDWRPVLRLQGERKRLPAPLVGLAGCFVEARLRTSFDELDWTDPDRAALLRVPAVVVHGAEDSLVPPETSRRFADAAPGAVELELTAGAGHVGSWNVDPVGYERLLRRLCHRLVAPAAPAARR